MANMSLQKNPMPSQDPVVRSGNFNEVALGYTEEQALDEAARCLQCKTKPCMKGCPVMINIPEFIKKIEEKDYEGAYQVIAATSALPAVCGRVCPQETQCEKFCTRGVKGEPVGIGRLERFVADWHNSHAVAAAEKPAYNGHRVAIVGSGPSGLTCAGDLVRLGYQVTVFEALHQPGGGASPSRPMWWWAAASAWTTCSTRASRRCSSAPAQACPCSWTSPASMPAASSPPMSS